MSHLEPFLDPIARLNFEHRQIDRVLVAMSEVAIRICSGAPANHAFFAATVDFIERFADGRHHAKEEGALFGEAWAQGFARSGPLACMMNQHEMGRDLTRSMKAWVEGSSDVRATSLNDMLSAATQYTNLLWNHIATENQVLFPALKESLPCESLARVLACYDVVDPSRPEEFRLAADSVVGLAGAASVERGAVEQAVAR